GQAVGAGHGADDDVAAVAAVAAVGAAAGDVLLAAETTTAAAAVTALDEQGYTIDKHGGTCPGPLRAGTRRGFHTNLFIIPNGGLVARARNVNRKGCRGWRSKPGSGSL